MVLYDIISYYIILYDIIRYCTIWYRIWYEIITYHILLFYSIRCYNIWYHIIYSYCVVLSQIAWFDMNWYDIIQYIYTILYYSIT